VYDAKRAEIACRFFERILKHTADEYYGKPFMLAPWQRDVLTRIFGEVDDDGNRTIQQIYLEVPKKSGKTEFVAGLILLLLTLEQTKGAQIYGAAAGVRQAMNVFRAACKMVEQSPILQDNLRILRSTNRILKRDDPDSFYAAIAGDGDMSDGINPLCAVVDEVHRWKTRKQLENWDVLSKGGITRRQTLTIGITTAGVQDESPLAWRLHEKTRKISEGVVSDPRFYGRIYGALNTDDPGDPETWIKANPSLRVNGGFLELDKIKKEYESAVAEGDLTGFKRYFLNIWDQKADRAIDMAKWEASSGPWKAAGLLAKPPEDVVRPIPRDLLARFIERRCSAGADLSMTTDLSSLVFVFRDEEADSFEVLPFFWIPEADIRKREIRDGVPYRQWAKEGFIELCPGEVIDYRLMQARIEWGARMFDLQDVAFDPWNSRQISVPLNEAGITCVEIRQGYQSLSEPSKKLLELVAQGKLWHGGHPVMRWNASCVASTSDGRDNMMFTKPDRKKDSARIDGIAASVNGLARAMIWCDDGAAAYYRSGLMIL
jgi:phage terminase large subunit-like protein